jgi:hypothetical protein
MLTIHTYYEYMKKVIYIKARYMKKKTFHFTNYIKHPQFYIKFIKNNNFDSLFTIIEKYIIHM